MDLIIRKNEYGPNKLEYPVKIMDSYYSRLKGLMFKNTVEKGLVFKIPKSKTSFTSAIHMFFMLIPIDILFIDENDVIYDMISIKPWKTYQPKYPAKYVIELEKGTIKNNNLSIGDEIHFRGNIDFILEH
ncbi:DUF192 domain-containing protein [Methanobrevibacter filiformis]|uniref:ACR n=1 Tax=Methanobrevibacter filiformis TaxID=55758 RepID=A0A166CG40_9EURY|nr:DUF192 domain-containing protein [Methanobrevibacter filiformis]KZX14473.1 hypothetical protein MBFIL_08700 [Methanobrevibacter filiformis]